MSNEERELRLAATYHSATGDNFMVYADGGYARLSHLAEDGSFTEVYEGEYCEAIAQFAELAMRDVAPGLACPCGEDQADCTHPACDTPCESDK